jgi:hypothetical protein
MEIFSQKNSLMPFCIHHHGLLLLVLQVAPILLIDLDFVNPKDVSTNHHHVISA